MSSLTHDAADGVEPKDGMIMEDRLPMDTESEPCEPFVHSLARLGYAVEIGETPRWEAIEQLVNHPLVNLYCEQDGWSINKAYLMVADALDNWVETLFEIMVFDPANEGETHELRHVIAMWALGATYVPAPDRR